MQTHRNTHPWRHAVGLLLLWLCWTSVLARLPQQAAIASAHPLATQAGFEILRQHGNAFDAAVAVSAALAVVEPSGSGLGGGGFWLLHRDADGKEVLLDGRETAPLAAHRNLYLDGFGQPKLGLSQDGALAAGIPGMPAGLVYLAERYGRLPLATSLQPAIRIARDGFAITPWHINKLGKRLVALQNNPEAARLLLDHGRLPTVGTVLRQPELAATLEQLAAHGKAGFYQGNVAKRLVDAVRQGGGIWTAQDLLRYQIIERDPLRGKYRGIAITSSAPPSSGGTVLLEALQILAQFDWANTDPLTRKHLLIEAMRRAYHDRALYLGDPDFVAMPLRRLLSADYAAGLANTIRPDQAMPSTFLEAAAPAHQDGNDTTHFSIIDRDGNRVAATLSLNLPFGAAFAVPGTGVLLNDQMDDFVSAPGVANHFGLVGGGANSIAPGKRMLSSMTPTFLDDGERVAILGTPGGSRIISMLLLATLDYADGHAPESWVSLPRFHHQYLPDVVEYEPGALDSAEISALQQRGHRLQATAESYGNMQAVLWLRGDGQVFAASDPRGEGVARVE